jgi:glycerophosphoryl diester phosphodiesterase
VAVVTHIWTVNDPLKALRLWHQGVQGIITDDPAAILAARSRTAFV